MSNNERTTDTIINDILSAMRQDPAEMEKFIRGAIEDGIGLVAKAEWDSDDIVYASERLADRLKSWYEPDTGDVELIANEYEIEYEDIEDQYKRPEDEPLDVWLVIPDGEEEAEYEANTFRRYNGDYVIEWYHNAVGLVTTETFGTYEEAVSWYEENGYQDFTV